MRKTRYSVEQHLAAQDQIDINLLTPFNRYVQTDAYRAGNFLALLLELLSHASENGLRRSLTDPVLRPVVDGLEELSARHTELPPERRLPPHYRGLTKTFRIMVRDHLLADAMRGWIYANRGMPRPLPEDAHTRIDDYLVRLWNDSAPAGQPLEGIDTLIELAYYLEAEDANAPAVQYMAERFAALSFTTQNTVVECAGLFKPPDTADLTPAARHLDRLRRPGQKWLNWRQPQFKECVDELELRPSHLFTIPCPNPRFIPTPAAIDEYIFKYLSDKVHALPLTEEYN
ncbi:hypothetical protein BJ085DRAFT_37054 [Dimargaris cristalligena]|uniref:Uncharacterized protein n=1 Tax=Dimargaris cristalligena TaxID=215637 RepID=A0A4V1J4H3_9FUNG|nr:hypothetical protein BJ085DRAFT_37054 [Dimargaris cristalligena]|eukprot:RKP35559.1 hypothetical protein BJ085DRAFT_37054 [Dimargaris cristalligena]